jgi:hypothetical protein
MYSSLAYKEWLKVRWTFAITFLIGLAVLFSVYLNLRAIVEFNNANMVWNYIVFKGYMFFGQFKYIPFLIGLAVGIAQFLPEIQSLRLKLTLHLPLREDSTLLFMLFFGFSLVVVQFVVYLLLLVLISVGAFPAEITVAMVVSVLPWFIAGVATYFLTAVIMIEQLWFRRMALALFGFGFIDILFTGNEYGEYVYVLVQFALFTLLLGYLIVLSGFRFKRGVR